MVSTPHTLLVSHGAVSLAEEQNIETADLEYLVTEAGRQEWETYKQYNHTVTDLFRSQTSGHDTVGAVARDKVRNNFECNIFEAYHKFRMEMLPVPRQQEASQARDLGEWATVLWWAAEDMLTMTLELCPPLVTERASPK